MAGYMAEREQPTSESRTYPVHQTGFEYMTNFQVADRLLFGPTDSMLMREAARRLRQSVLDMRDEGDVLTETTYPEPGDPQPAKPCWEAPHPYMGSETVDQYVTRVVQSLEAWVNG
jgi:hypothetical protein